MKEVNPFVLIKIKNENSILSPDYLLFYTFEEFVEHIEIQNKLFIKKYKLNKKKYTKTQALVIYLNYRIKSGKIKEAYQHFYED